MVIYEPILSEVHYQKFQKFATYSNVGEKKNYNA